MELKKKIIKFSMFPVVAGIVIFTGYQIQTGKNFDFIPSLVESISFDKDKTVQRLKDRNEPRTYTKHKNSDAGDYKDSAINYNDLYFNVEKDQYDKKHDLHVIDVKVSNNRKDAVNLDDLELITYKDRQGINRYEMKANAELQRSSFSKMLDIFSFNVSEPSINIKPYTSKTIQVKVYGSLKNVNLEYNDNTNGLASGIRIPLKN